MERSGNEVSCRVNDEQPTARPLKSFSDLAQNWLKWGSRYINVWNFRVFCRFFWKIWKNSDLKFENRNFFFKFPLLQRSFFREFFFVWNFAHLNFRTNKFSEFWNIWDFFKKFWKKSKLSKNFWDFSRIFFCLKLRTLKFQDK